MADIDPSPQRIRVKRDGPRGWHWIAAANFDPKVHELFDEEQPAPAIASTPTQPDKPRLGRPPKNPQERQHGHR